MRTTRTLSSLRWIVATLALLIAVGVIVASGERTAPAAPPPSPPLPPSPAAVLDKAVAATLTAGSARIAGTVRTADGLAGSIDGAASFRSRQSVFTTSAAGAPPAMASEVRVRPDGAWLRVPGTAEWIDLEMGDAAGGAAGARSDWAAVLGEVADATDVVRDPRARDRLRGRLGDRTVEAELDGRGRLRRLRVVGTATSLDVRLRDHGAPVVVDVPSPVVSSLGS